MKFFYLFPPASHNKSFLYTAERGRKKGAWAENWKWEVSENDWDTWVSDLVALELDHLQPFKPIFVQKFPPLSTISLLPAERGRKEQWLNIRNGNSSKMNETWPWVFKLDHLQPVKPILVQNSSTFPPVSHKKQFFILHRERKEGRSRGWKLKWTCQKWMRHRGF